MCMDFLSIFEILILSSLIGDILVLAILAIKKLLKNNLTPAFHYYIWVVLIIKLIIPYGPETSLNISNIYENNHIQVTTNENTEKVHTDSSIQAKTYQRNSIQKEVFQSLNKGVNNIPISISLENRIHVEKIFFYIWITIVALLIGVLMVGYKKLRGIIRTSIKVVNTRHKNILNNYLKIMNIKTDVELLYSSKISSPSLCGLIKPKIFIPNNIAFSISDEEFRYIIMHELTHLKNKDIIINWILTLLSIIYWFNPILIYSFHKMRQDCEYSCDDKVISYLDQGENVQYGNTLIRVLELVGKTNKIVGTTSMVINNSEIKRRIIMISKYKKITIKNILFGAIAVVIIASLGILLNASNRNIAKATSFELQRPVATSENIDNNAMSTSTTKISSDTTTPIGNFPYNIVIYNSHPNEDYTSGLKVTDVGALINDKLIKEGLKSSFIKCSAPEEYINSYSNTRKLITENVNNYSNTILLDIHRNEADNQTKYDTRKILFQLAKNNPHYEENKKFAECLLEHIKTSKEVETEIYSYNNGKLCFNQDLSNNSVLIEIGNSMSSDTDIESCVNAIVQALKNSQNTLSN
jgi:Antirepressor regulating drug resistance, predicted signal transduction N-terminal membrane component